MPQQNSTPEKKEPRRKRKWEDAFLAGLSEVGNIKKASELAGIERTVAYLLRESAPDFAEAWENAIQKFADSLEQEATRRARDGVNEPVIYKGELMGVWVNEQNEQVESGTPGAKFVPLTVKKYSDVLLIFMLKGIRPEKYRDNATLEVTGKNGGPVQHHVTIEEFRKLPLADRLRICRTQVLKPADN